MTTINQDPEGDNTLIPAFIPISQVAGLVGSLNVLQASAAAHDERFKAVEERLDVAYHRIFVLHLLLLGAVIALGCVADYAGLFTGLFR